MPVRIPTLDGKVDYQVLEAFNKIVEHANAMESQNAALQKIVEAIKTPTFDQIRRALSSSGPTPLNLTGLIGTPAALFVPATVGGRGTVPPVDPLPGPTPSPTLACSLDISAGQPGGVPVAPNLRWVRGDFCGVTVPGLPAVAGGSADTSLVFSPHLDRYSAPNQTKILAAHTANHYTHFLLSWPDSRDGNGQSIAQFTATAQAVQAAGFYPVIALFSKDFDGQNPDPSSVDAVLASLIGAGAIPMCKIAWEMNLFNDPGPTTQALIDHVTGILVPAGTRCYVHFSEGYVAWQAPGDPGAAFWEKNQGKLRGIMHQKDLTWDCGMYQARLVDLQIRFGTGAAGWPATSGFGGDNFDIIAWEHTAALRFNTSVSEAQSKIVGTQAISSASAIPIMGSGNGCPVV